MRAAILVVLTGACGGEPGQPAPAAQIIVKDAAVTDVMIDAPKVVRAEPHCAFEGALEEIVIDIDPATSMGTLTRTSPGRNHRRNINVRIARESDTAFDVVFVGYGAGDYAPILNWHGPSPRREKMTPDKSIVARVEVRDGLARIIGREVDLHTEMTYQTPDHSYPCALIDGEFFKAHPHEFIR